MGAVGAAQGQLIEDAELRAEGADAVLQVRLVSPIQFARSVGAPRGDIVQAFYEVLPAREVPGLVAGDRIRRVIEAKAQQNGVSFKEQETAQFQSVSIKDYVTPQQLADMVVFTASPRAKTISGQAISVCGDTNSLG